MFDNYISIGRNFMTEKNYLKALKFFKKAYNWNWKLFPE